jgi:hypothetical protein
LALFVKSAAASTASRPNAPPPGQDEADKEVIWVKGKLKYFCKRGWTGPLQNSPLICPSG